MVGPFRGWKTRKVGTGEGLLVPFGDSCLRAESWCAQTGRKIPGNPGIFLP